ncbi:MAG: D-alanine--D-alanine ligase [Calditrichaeota bacterium]|nr:MAG: D-alanine--D-alanine ligase [Calditrichota bacterium]MBL1206948.1 D-alanine--D-alanine ligase [Calditrichota bacterium]NOG46775.1 D-alanine--D-alanine ligase [Calditrichota bacterium]
MKIAVLLGGSSPERDVSLDSGKNIAEALRINGHQVLEIDPSLPTKQLLTDLNISLDEGKILEKESGLYGNIFLLKQLDVDLVFNGLHGGDGENGVIQTLLETLNIKFTGSGSMACMQSMDKEISKMLLLQNGLPTANFVTIKNETDEFDLSGLSFPVIVKPADGGSSLGHTILADNAKIQTAIKFAFEYGEKVLIEEFISGKEIAAGVLDGKPLPLVHIKPTHEMYDYECKYTPGMSSYEVPAQLDHKSTNLIQEYACKMYKLLGCSGYTRIDFIVSKENRLHILEANTLPGMTSTSLFPKAAKEAGYPFEELIEKIVQDAI